MSERESKIPVTFRSKQFGDMVQYGECDRKRLCPQCYRHSRNWFADFFANIW